MKIDPHYRQQKCRRIIEVSVSNVYEVEDIHRVLSSGWDQTTVWLSKTAITSTVTHYRTSLESLR